MKLVYATRVDLSSSAAQAKQIKSMSEAFYSVLGQCFELIAAGDEDVELDCWWKKLPPKRSQSARLVMACVYMANRRSCNTSVVYFTRDIGLAFFSVFILRRRAIYEAHKEPKTLAAKLLFYSLSRSSKFGIISISDALKEYYISNHGVPRSAILALHDGAFPEKYGEIDRSQVRVSLGLPVDKMLVVHTGSLYKGGAEYFGEVAKELGQEGEFWHIGGSEKEVARWREYYKEEGIDNVVLLPQQSSESVTLYQQCADVLFYITTRRSPIYWCTSPLKVFEYMASGVPILGANIGSVGEVLNDENAFCFDPDKPGSIGRLVREILTNPDEARRRASRARKEVEDHYDWRHRAEAIIAFAKEKH